MYVDTIFNSLIPFQPPFSHLPHSRHGLYAHPRSRYWPLIFHPYRSRCILFRFLTQPYHMLPYYIPSLIYHVNTLPYPVLLYPTISPCAIKHIYSPHHRGHLFLSVDIALGRGVGGLLVPPPPQLVLAQRIDGRTLNSVFRISVKTTLFAVGFFLLLLLLLFFCVCFFRNCLFSPP